MNEIETFIVTCIHHTSVISICLSTLGMFLFGGILLLNLRSEYTVITIVGLIFAKLLFIVSIISLFSIKDKLNR